HRWRTLDSASQRSLVAQPTRSSSRLAARRRTISPSVASLRLGPITGASLQVHGVLEIVVRPLPHIAPIELEVLRPVPPKKCFVLLIVAAAKERIQVPTASHNPLNDIIPFEAIRHEVLPIGNERIPGRSSSRRRPTRGCVASNT